jgi:hypothetical protein
MPRDVAIKKIADKKFARDIHMIAKRSAAVSACALFALVMSAAFPARAAVMKQKAYREAFVALVAAEKNLPAWLAQITGKEDYVAEPETHATIDGVTYRLFHACKPHDCAYNELEVMFSPGGAPAYALLIEDNKPKRWFGNPNAAQQAALTQALEE